MKCSEKTTHKLKENTCTTSNCQSTDTDNINKTLLNQSIGKGQRTQTKKQAKWYEVISQNIKNIHHW